MKTKKNSVWHAVLVCFRYAPGAAFVKLLIEIANGAIAPLMVLVVAAFIDNSLALVSGNGEILSVITSITMPGIS